MALELLSDMEGRGVTPDVVTYNSVINVLRWGGQRERALEVLDGMNRGRKKGTPGDRDGEGEAEGVRPDVITYNSVIAACAAGGSSG